MEEVTRTQALEDSPNVLGDSPPGQRLYSYLCCLMLATLTRCMCEMLASYACSTSVGLVTQCSCTTY